MFRAIGFLIVLWGLSNFFSSSFIALDGAARESFRVIESAAVAAQMNLKK